MHLRLFCETFPPEKVMKKKKKTYNQNKSSFEMNKWHMATRCAKVGKTERKSKSKKMRKER